MPMLAEEEVLDVSCPNDRSGCEVGTTPLSLKIAEGLSLLSLEDGKQISHRLHQSLHVSHGGSSRIAYIPNSFHSGLSGH